MTIYRSLELIATDEEHPGLLAVGALVDGAFVTLAAVKLGTIDQLKAVPTSLAVAEADAAPTAPETPPADTPPATG